MEGKITGQFHTWNLLGHQRSYADISLPYAEAVEYVMPVRYNALTGKGEQRELCEAHVRKLRREMEDGNYTPTQVSAGLRKTHLASLTKNGDRFELVVNSDDPLPQTDGGHRYEALGRIHKHLVEQIEKNPEDKALQERLENLNRLPVGIRIYFDGSPQKDFIALQAGRSVDAAHMLSMRIQQRVIDDPAFKTAFDVAKHLLKADKSPFQGQIRLDSRGINPLPISTLCSKGASDLGTSLVGLAKVGSHGKQKAEWLAQVLVQAYTSIQEKIPEALNGGKVLTPISNGGSKGSSTMLIGVAVCVAYRLLSLEREWGPAEVQRLVQSVRFTLNESVNGHFSGPDKRKLLGAFARDYLSDVETETHHDDLPVQLLKLLSPSAFAASQLPKEKKARAKKSAEEPVVVTNEAVPVADTQAEEEVSDESCEQEVPWGGEEPVGAGAGTGWQEEMMG